MDHDERKREILHKALHLFADLGYPQVTFQQIADVCGLSRTVLYNYFQNKREIFDNALYQLVQNIGSEFNETVTKNPRLRASAKLELVLRQAVDLLLKNPALLQSIIEYLIAQKRQGESVEKRIRRHTVGFRRTLQKLIQEGMETGEFRHMIATQAADMLFGLMQAVSIRIMFYDETDREQLITHCHLMIESMKKIRKSPKHTQ